MECFANRGVIGAGGLDRNVRRFGVERYLFELDFALGKPLRYGRHRQPDEAGPAFRALHQQRRWLLLCGLRCPLLALLHPAVTTYFSNKGSGIPAEALLFLIVTLQ